MKAESESIMNKKEEKEHEEKDEKKTTEDKKVEEPKKIAEKPKEAETNHYVNKVDGQQVPVPHFGIILSWENFKTFSEHLKHKKVEFIIEPYVRFEGLVGEQATLFFYDPSGNALESSLILKTSFRLSELMFSQKKFHWLG